MPSIRLATIKRQKRFQEIYLKGKKFSTSNLFMVIECAETETRAIEYAVVASKKVSKRAVVRNRVKRLLRECLRLNIHLLLEDGVNISGIILYWRAPVEKAGLIRLADVVLEYLKIVEKFKLTISKNQNNEAIVDNID